jgi:hypothetical protein
MMENTLVVSFMFTLNQNRMQITNPTRLVLAWKAMAYTLKFN